MTTTSKYPKGKLMPYPSNFIMRDIEASGATLHTRMIYQAVTLGYQPLESLDSLQGSLTESEDVDTLRRREREAELVKDRRWFR